MTGPQTPRMTGRSIVVSALGLAAAVVAGLLGDAGAFPQRFALCAAGVSLACSICAALTHRWSRSSLTTDRGPGEPLGAFGSPALVTGVAATLALAALVAARGRIAMVDVLSPPPLEQPPASTFFAGGLAAWGLLTGACGLQLAATRNRRLITPLFCMAVLGVVWVSLRVPVYLRTPQGVYARSAWALVLSGGLAGVLCGFVIVQGVLRRWQRARWLRTDPGRLLEAAPHWPGFRASCAAIGLVLVLLVCYHLVLGSDAEPVGHRLAALAMTCITAGSAAALLVLLGRGWSVNLADIGMGLVCVAACCAALTVLPGKPTALPQRFPLILNALLFGLALMTWLWNWLSCVWRQQLDAGVAWTTAGEMITPATRMAFLAGAVGLAVASMMIVWPRLPMVAAMDHSIGRLVGGVAGHLLLLWAALWGARRAGQARFIGLAVLAVISLVAFVYVRTVPLTTSAF